MALQSIQQTAEASATYSIDPEKFGIGRQGEDRAIAWCNPSTSRGLRRIERSFLLSFRHFSFSTRYPATTYRRNRPEGEDNYLAYFDPGDDQNYVLRNCGLTLGTVKPTDPGQVLMSLSAKCNGQVDSTVPGRPKAMAWLLTARFEQWNFSFGDPADVGDPVKMETRWELDYERMPEPVLRDINKKPLLNSAQDPFDPPIEQAGLIYKLTVRRNEKAPDFGTLLGLADTLNIDAWNGIPAKWVKFCPPRIPQREWSEDGQYYFWPMTYEFEINRRTWQARPANLGYNKIENGKKVLITDEAGQPLQQPGILNTDGSYVKPPVPDNQVVYLKFDIYQDVDWSGLDLDDLPDFTFTAPDDDDTDTDPPPSA